MNGYYMEIAGQLFPSKASQWNGLQLEDLGLM